MNNTHISDSAFTPSRRILWVDLLRAIPMFFVVLVHASSQINGWWLYNVLTGPIMLPLFFAISGYLFNDQKGTKAFFTNLFKKLVIPWLFLSLIWAKILLIPFRGLDYWLEALYNLISGRSLWFMPACILAEIILHYVLKLSNALQKRYQLKSGTGLVCCFSVLCTVLGFVLARLNMGNFAMFNRALIAQSFLLIGFLFRKFENALTARRCRNAIAGTVIYLLLAALSVIMYPGQYIDVHLNMYPSIPIYFLMIYSGCFTLLIIFSAIQKAPKLPVIFGQNTLVCYAIHHYGFAVINKGLAIVGISLSLSWPVAILMTVFSIIMCILVSSVLNFVLPEAVGKTRKRKQI